MNQGAPRKDVFSCLIEAAELVCAPRAVSSILVLDEQGLLRNGHSPGLPADYLAAIDRLKPHPRVGTCAAAAATGVMVVIFSIAIAAAASLRRTFTPTGMSTARLTSRTAAVSAAIVIAGTCSG